jgi:hypothetical protein
VLPQPLSSLSKLLAVLVDDLIEANHIA